MINKTRRIRYEILFWYMKRFNPKFYEMVKDCSKNGLIRIKEMHLYDSVPRPSILEIKNRLNSKKLKGLEIGVCDGKNALSIYKTLNIEKLYLIDSWSNYNRIDMIRNNHNDNYHKVLRMFEGYYNVYIIKGFSNEVNERIIDNTLDFIYIDGNHKYEYVLNDLTLYYPKVKPNGFICGHDINFDSVKFAVYDFCKKYNLKFKNMYPDFFIQKGN